MRILLPTLLLLLAPVAAACELGTAGDLLPDCPPQDDPVSDLCRVAGATPILVDDAHAFASAWFGAAARPGQTACASSAELCGPGETVDAAAGLAWNGTVAALDAADFFVHAGTPIAHVMDDDAENWSATQAFFIQFVPTAEDAPLLCGLGYETPCTLAALPPQAQRDAYLASDRGVTLALLAPGVAYDAGDAVLHALREAFATGALPCPPLP